MSQEHSVVEDRHFKYIGERTTPEDPLLRDLKAAAREDGLPEIWIAPEQVALLQILLRASGARRVLEVGTLGGLSAIGMARALPADGRVTTIEIESKHADFAERWIARSDVAGKIEVRRGAGMEVLPT